MSLIWIHNPDYYDTGTLERYWSTFDADAEVTAGYDSTNGLTASALGSFVTKKLAPGDSVNFAFGGRFFIDAYPASRQVLLAPINGDGLIQCSLCLNTDGTLSAMLGDDAGTVLITSADPVELSTWIRLGFKGTVDRANGSVEVHVDSTRALENIVARVSGVNTAEEDSADWSGIYIGLGTDIICGHLYAVDGGGVVTGLLHGLRVEVLFPDTVGAFDEWAATGGAFPAVVADAVPDDDTTKITANAFNQRYSSIVDTLATTEKLHGVQTESRVRNIENSGYSPSHTPMIVVETTPYFGIWQSCVNDEWRQIWKMWPVHPRTGVPWIVADINASEWGGRVNA